MQKTELLNVFDQNQASFNSDWMELLRFKSISTDGQYQADCLKCAEWLESHLKGIGFKAELITTPTKPLVFAEWEAPDPNAPVVLYYGHYDVQPVDPVDAWKSPPFDPEIRDGRMYARGAEDNKGQTAYVIKALETLVKNNALNCTVKLLLEGEEESGSGAINKMVDGLKDKIKADVLMVCDTGSLSSQYETITMGLRGILAIEIKLDGPAYDLHSGVYGGVVLNPATEMARLIATLHNPDGSIAVDGYYDKVKKPDASDLKLAEAAPLNIAGFEKQIGTKLSGGEAGLSFPERRGFRPTIEINGLHSGYGGAGGKTIIPSSAIAKISARLAAGQDPDECLRLIEEHCKKHAHPDLKFSVVDKHVGGPALCLQSDSDLIKKAKSVLDNIGQQETVFMWEGASIPIIPKLAAAASAEPLIVGFGQEDDCIHAPNESFALEQFKKGFLYVCMMLQSLAEK